MNENGADDETEQSTSTKSRGVSERYGHRVEYMVAPDYWHIYECLDCGAKTTQRLSRPNADYFEEIDCTSEET